MATATATLDMAKKRAKKEEATPPTGDTFHLKLPVEYWWALQAIEAREGRPMTVSGQMALEMYFRKMGVRFEENWPEVGKTKEP